MTIDFQRHQLLLPKRQNTTAKTPGSAKDRQEEAKRTMIGKLNLVFLVMVLLGVSGAGAVRADEAGSRLDTFNYVIGTQTFGPAYQFTDEAPLVETAKAIRAMGSNAIKFRLGEGTGKKAGVGVGVKFKTLREIAAKDPATARVLEMPFSFYLIWVYPLATEYADRLGAKWGQAESDAEYREMYELTQYLLKKFAGTGKRFYLGHWEGDWTLMGGKPDPQRDPTPERVAGMIRWLNLRQKAVADARRDTPHQNVEVYHYTEVNLVRKAMAGKPTVTNDVLPKVNVDYVSYSSYDSLGGKDIRGDMKRALDYIEAKLPKKEGIPGRRVFIGEYGFPAVFNTPAQQEAKSREVLRAALEWGCPFCLYWEMYNNEVDKDGKQRGFWLIDDKGVKQPVYETHRKFYEAARRWVEEFKKKEGRAPSAEEFGKAGAERLIPN